MKEKTKINNVLCLVCRQYFPKNKFKIHSFREEIAYWFVELDKIHPDIKKYLKTKRSIREICVIKEQISLLMSQL